MQSTSTITALLRATILLLLGLTASICSMAQVTISGVVTDEKGVALPGANVFILGTYDGTSTDAAGLFRFSTEPSDTATLRVDFIGYAPYSLPLVLKSGEMTGVEVKLKEVFNELKAVTITGSGFEASDSKRAVALKPLDIVTTAGAAGDVAGALQTLPGTTTVGESGRLFVRGGSADETQTYVDGLLVHEPYTRTPANTAVRGRFNPFIFSGTVFNTGGYSAEYGQALSSVLLLETKGIELEDEWNLSLMTVGVDFAGTKVWEKGSVTATLGYIDLTPYMSVVPQNFEYERLPLSLNGSVSLRQKTGKTGLFKMYGNFAATRYDIYDDVPGQEETQRVDGGDNNSYANASWRDVIAKKWSLKTGVAFSQNIEEVEVDGDSGFKETTTGWHLKAVAIHDLSDKVDIRFGLDQFMREKEYVLRSEEAFSSMLDLSRTGVFAETDFFISTDLAFKAGLRMEHTPSTTFASEATTVVPRLTTALRTGDDSQLSAAYGIFYQEPSDDIFFQAQGVEQERADHYILNYQYTTSKQVFRAEVYHKDYSDLAKFGLNGTVMGVNNSGSGYARGLDLWWRDRKSIKNGDYWLSYSYLDTERDYRDYPEAATPGFAATHNFSVVYKHWIPKWRSQVGGTFAYTSARAYDDPNSDAFLAARIDPIHQVNVNWAYLHRENVIFYGAVSNVFGQRQQFGYEFADSPDENGTYASSPILPSANRFFFVGCFITWSKKAVNQLDKIN